MKRGKIIAGIGLLMLLISVACKNELDDRYENPDRTADATIDQFFTSMLNNNRVRPQ